MPTGFAPAGVARHERYGELGTSLAQPESVTCPRSPTGRSLAVGARYGTIQVWDVAEQQRRQTFAGLAGDVWAVAFSPDGRRLVGVDTDWRKPGLVKIWRTETWKEERALRHTGEVLCVAFDPSGQWLAAGGWDGRVRVWNLR